MPVQTVLHIGTDGVSDRCAIKATPDGKPDFSALLSYGNEAVMLEKLITETEKEMQAVRDAAKEKDLQKLDSLIHHLRSSWEVLRADQPLNVLTDCFVAMLSRMVKR